VVTPAHFIALSVILFVIGAVGVPVRRNAIVVFMVVAAAEVVGGLAILTAIFRSRRSSSVDDANLMKY